MLVSFNSSVIFIVSFIEIFEVILIELLSLTPKTEEVTNIARASIIKINDCNSLLHLLNKLGA